MLIINESISELLRYNVKLFNNKSLYRKFKASLGYIDKHVSKDNLEHIISNIDKLYEKYLNKQFRYRQICQVLTTFAKAGKECVYKFKDLAIKNSLKNRSKSFWMIIASFKILENLQENIKDLEDFFIERYINRSQNKKNLSLDVGYIISLFEEISSINKLKILRAAIDNGINKNTLGRIIEYYPDLKKYSTLL